MPTFGKTVKNFEIRGKGKTTAAANSLKNVGNAASRAGKHAGQAAGKFQSFAGRMNALERRMGKVSASLGRLNNLLGAAGLVAAGVAAGRAIDGMVTRSFQLQAVMGNLPIGINKAKQATMGLVSEFDLAKAAAAAVRLKVVKSDEEFAKLAKTAVKLGVSLGQDATESLNNLVEGLGRGSTEVLDNLGILVRAKESYEAYGKSIGKAAKDLTEAEKRQATINMGLAKGEAAADKVTVKVDEMTKNWLEAKTAVRDIADEVLPAVTSALAGTLGLIQATSNALANLGIAIAGLPGFDQKTTKHRGLDPSSVRPGAAGFEATFGAFKSEQDLKDIYGGSGRTSGAAGTPLGGPKKPRGGGGRRGPGVNMAAAAALGALPDRSGEFVTPEEMARQLEESNRAYAQKVRDREREVAEITLEERLFAIEQQRAAGVDPIQLIRDEETAQLEYLETMRETSTSYIEIKAIELDSRRAQHEAEMAMLEERRKAEMEDLKWRQMAATSTAAAMHTVAVAAVMAEGNRAKAIGDALKTTATANVIHMTGVAATETALGFAAAASPFTAALAPGHFAAAKLALAAAGFWTGVGAIGAGISAGAGGGGGGRRETRFGSAQGQQGGPGGPRSGPGGGGGLPSVPRSLDERTGTVGSSGVGGGGPRDAGGSTYIINNPTVLGGTTEQVGVAMKRLITDAETSAGRTR